MRVRTIALALTSSVILTACGAQEHPKTASDACLVFKPLSYANAKAGQEHADDPGNRYDTPETIEQIDSHDAVYDRLCPSSR